MHVLTLDLAHKSSDCMDHLNRSFPHGVEIFAMSICACELACSL